MSNKRRVGIVGYGKLGQSLARAIIDDPAISTHFELAFVWNRRFELLVSEGVPEDLRLKSLDDFAAQSPDLIVEVAHPVITEQYGQRILEHCDYLVGSPTAFAKGNLEAEMRAAAKRPTGHGLYIPRGALPGLEEVLRLVAANKLEKASITMRKHPSSLKYSGPLDPPLESAQGPRELYRGPLRDLCQYAPNNVNTMAVLALASQLGFDSVEACLVADPGLAYHITEVQLVGPEQSGHRFSLDLIRKSPAPVGAVSSTATLSTFLESMVAAGGAGDGVHFC